MKIAQTDPQAEYLACREAIDAAISSVLRGGRYILGEEVARFEEEFAAYLGAGHAIGVASGTDALSIALRASGVEPGDEVLTVAHTAVATVAAIEQCGARAVLLDVRPDTFTLDSQTLAGALTARTRAIVPVHLYGQAADMRAILDFARAHRLTVVEDCAQAHGAQYRASADQPWKKAGTLGHAAAFSFYPTKNLGAIGDGGCVMTNDPAIAERARLLRQYGWRERYVSEVRGFNSRLDEIQAAILRIKLRELDGWNNIRSQRAALYDHHLDGALTLPARASGCTHVFHQYVVRIPERDAVRAELTARGIPTAIHYPVPVHRQPAYHVDGLQLPVTESLSREILSLPMHPHLSAAAAAHVATTLKLILRSLDGGGVEAALSA